jgi:hypothetical protein
MVAFGAKQVLAIAGRMTGQDFSLPGFGDPAEATLCCPLVPNLKKVNWNE